MKKIYFLFICFFACMGIQAQQLSGLQLIEVLASDDFEDDEAWVNFDQPGINTGLNNALGGTQDYAWADTWGGACVHGGKSAVSGNNCVQLHWGGSLVLQGFEIDQEKIYQVEVMVHPIGGMSGEWNNWAALHLYVFDSSNVWQSQGVRIRLSNNDPAGGSPSLLALDVWEGEDGTERPVNLLSFSEDINKYSIADAADNTAQNFWIPLKVIFTGAGTIENPLILDFYLNDIFVATQTLDNIVWFGDFMIGLQNGADNPDVCRYDNFKLSVFGKGSDIESVQTEKIVVTQVSKNQLQVSSDVFGQNVEYRLFNTSGLTLKQGILDSSLTIVPTGALASGVYVLQVKDRSNGFIKTIRTIVK